jgi:hypothetical protein
VKLGIGYSVLPFWITGSDWHRGELSVLRGAEPSMHRHGFLYRASSNMPQSGLTLARIALEWREWWTLARFVQPVPER